VGLLRRSSALLLLAMQALPPVPADEFAPIEVGITPEMDLFTVLHGGETVWIRRDQDVGNVVDPEFALTSRPCPPFCIQPMRVAPGVETLGELELIGYLERVGRDPSVLVVDTRTSDEVVSGVIPGAVNVPWNDLVPSAGAVDFVVYMRLEEFGVLGYGEALDFSQAKTLVLYCNGPWCGQTPSSIRALLDLGYPAERLKWYRGGMQAWRGFGFPIIGLH
jgi:rhodanese-related sulfurtransferase